MMRTLQRNVTVREREGPQTAQRQEEDSNCRLSVTQSSCELFVTRLLVYSSELFVCTKTTCFLLFMERHYLMKADNSFLSNLFFFCRLIKVLV